MAEPRIYYQRKDITIWLGDCRQVLPKLPDKSVDLILTDPPYNVGKDYGEHDDAMDDVAYHEFLLEVFSGSARLSDNLVYFPGTKNAMSSDYLRILRGCGFSPMRLLGWHKKEFAGDKWHGGPAMCWEPVIWAVRNGGAFFNTIYGSRGRDFMVVNSTHGHGIQHPCPKPLGVMRWLVNMFAPEYGTILDPFMGSGTTLVAAKQLGRKAIGIEICKDYCKIAIQRLQQEMLPLAPASPAVEKNLNFFQDS